jgi:hypothetical protein
VLGNVHSGVLVALGDAASSIVALGILAVAALLLEALGSGDALLELEASTASLGFENSPRSKPGLAHTRLNSPHPDIAKQLPRAPKPEHSASSSHDVVHTPQIQAKSAPH